MSLRTQLSTVFHRYLKVPYVLHVHEFRSPKKPRATYVFLHGIGNTLHAWDDVVALMPKDVRLIGIDLLGFGKSPKPSWAAYDAKTQARSVNITLLGLRLARQPILVGHSLGALVAVEVAKRYGMLVRRLVLCSPPFYKPEARDKKFKSGDDMLRTLYRTASQHPERLIKFSPMAVKLGLANKTFNINEDTKASYIGALEASIINQTSLEDVSELNMPIDIFYGTFDPVVIKKHITGLAKAKATVTAKRLVAGHEMLGSYNKSVARRLIELADIQEK